VIFIATFVFFMTIIIIILDGLPLIKNKQRKVFCVFISILVISIILISAYSLGITPPLQIATERISDVLKPIFNTN